MKIIRKQLKEILNNSTTDYVSNLRRKILLDYLEYNDGSDNLQVLLNIIDIADIKQLSRLSFFLRSKERMFRLALPNLNEKSLKKIFLEINDVNFKLNKKNIYIWSNSKLINKWIKKNKFIFCDFYNKLPEILSSNNYL
ncbi:MAG: hypothetical protein PHF21_03540, partial [Bacilli bacterium]|nr:hypothetical protein [Bacilli bacterium]